jgi:RimJ/RimL family protein N-acetyltransferase
MALMLPPSIEILTDNFLIRPMTSDDASPKMAPWIEDEMAAAMLNTRRRNWTVDQQLKYFSQHQGRQEKLLLGIFPKQKKEPIGLFILKLKRAQGALTISHLIGDKAWRGKNVTFEAAEAVYDYFFNTLGYVKVRCNVRPQNKPMLWLIYTYVWRKEATLTKHLRLPDSTERSDLLVFSILADEWRTRPEKFRFKPHNAGEAAGQKV